MRFRVARIEEPLSIRQAVLGEQDLSDAPPVLCEVALIGLAERDLPDRGGSLFLRDRVSGVAPLESSRPGGDRADPGGPRGPRRCDEQARSAHDQERPRAWMNE